MKVINHEFDEYCVRETLLKDGWVWLSIKYFKKEVNPSWRELQDIKNNICGEDREALEVYPPEEHIIDTLNHFHLWVMPKGRKFKHSRRIE